MSNRIVATVQIAVNSILLILVSTVYFLIPLVIAAYPVLDRAGLDGALDAIAARPQTTGILIVVAVFAFVCVILMLWLTKKYAPPNAYEGHASMWEHWFSGGLVGIIARFAWRGILNAQAVNAAKMEVRINKKWVLMSSVAGCISVTLIVMFNVPFDLPTNDSSFWAACLALGTSVLFFWGFNHAFRVGSRKEDGHAPPANPPNPPSL